MASKLAGVKPETSTSRPASSAGGRVVPGGKGATTSKVLPGKDSRRAARRSSPAGMATSTRAVSADMDEPLAVGDARIEGIAQPVADEIDAEHGHGDHDAGRDPEPGHLLEHGGRLGAVDHVAPARRRRLHAEPEEGETGLGQDGGGDAEGGGDD